MKRDATSVSFPTDPRAIEAAIEAAPEYVDDPDCPYDPNDPDAVDTFWRNAKVQYPKAAVRIDADVLAWFKRQGPDWQARMNEVLRAYVDDQQR
jgi:uncharacterized protein (DUF4415 family)